MGDIPTISILAITAALVVLLAGAAYLQFQAVKVEPFKGPEFVATGTYNTGPNRLTGTIENIGNKTYNYVEIRAKFYSSGGTVVSTDMDNFQNFAPREKYRFKMWSDTEILSGKVKLNVYVKQ